MAAESRLPPLLALVVLLLLIQGLHDHYRVFPDWVTPAAVALVALAMAGAALRGGAGWLRLERACVLLFATVLISSGVISLGVLIDRILENLPGADGLALLTSSVVIWGCNVIGFTLIYWQLDGGGPEGRGETAYRADWLFVEAANPAAVPPGWQPRFVDYLFLGFSTATAFSTTDTLPLTGRAKLLMMAQAMISLATLAVVASRAINVLGS